MRKGQRSVNRWDLRLIISDGLFDWMKVITDVWVVDSGSEGHLWNLGEEKRN